MHLHVSTTISLVALIGLQDGNPTANYEQEATLSICIAIKNAVVLDVPIIVKFEAISGTATRKKLSHAISIHLILQQRRATFLSYLIATRYAIHVTLIYLGC